MIVPPTPLDRNLQACLLAVVNSSPKGTNRSDVIRWGLDLLKQKSDGYHYEPERPMPFKSPSFVIDDQDETFLKERKRRLGIPVTQSVRDAIYAVYKDHKK